MHAISGWVAYSAVLEFDISFYPSEVILTKAKLKRKLEDSRKNRETIQSQLISWIHERRYESVDVVRSNRRMSKCPYKGKISNRLTMKHSIIHRCCSFQAPEILLKTLNSARIASSQQLQEEGISKIAKIELDS
ncbi:unnamed protein product [Ambrosiozyma monospora]|uniref:Unnamed protein product n=1 Tax=Ambrosiozyma monospora TaxID=43982 RepID=A0A9W6Z5N8_AMBMO|nr:unnamed protein product [Ambrosiozyma monospora]